MKKIFVLIGVMITMMITGCSTETYKETINYPDRVVEFEYKGHKYIMFGEYGTFTRNDITGVVHDPDCPCHKNNSNL